MIFLKQYFFITKSGSTTSILTLDFTKAVAGQSAKTKVNTDNLDSNVTTQASVRCVRRERVCQLQTPCTTTNITEVFNRKKRISQYCQRHEVTNEQIMLVATPACALESGDFSIYMLKYTTGWFGQTLRALSKKFLCPHCNIHD